MVHFALAASRLITTRPKSKNPHGKAWGFFYAPLSARPSAKTSRKEVEHDRHRAKAPTQPAHDPDVDLEAAREVLTRLHKGLPMWEPRVAAYLTKRGISREVIVEATHRGVVRMLPANPVHARDLMLRLAGGADQLARAGLWAGKTRAGQRRPSARCGSSPAGRVVVVEGAIDMLSMAQMGERRTIMAIPVACYWRLEWFVAAHQRYGSRFVIALDDDEAGNRMAAHLMGALNDRGIEAQRLVPPQGKDWNEALLAAVLIPF